MRSTQLTEHYNSSSRQSSCWHRPCYRCSCRDVYVQPPFYYSSGILLRTVTHLAQLSHSAYTFDPFLMRWNVRWPNCPAFRLSLEESHRRWRGRHRCWLPWASKSAIVQSCTIGFRRSVTSKPLRFYFVLSFRLDQWAWESELNVIGKS